MEDGLGGGRLKEDSCCRKEFPEEIEFWPAVGCLKDLVGRVGRVGRAEGGALCSWLASMGRKVEENEMAGGRFVARSCCPLPPPPPSSKMPLTRSWKELDLAVEVEVIDDDAVCCSWALDSCCPRVPISASGCCCLGCSSACAPNRLGRKPPFITSGTLNLAPIGLEIVLKVKFEFLVAAVLLDGGSRRSVAAVVGPSALLPLPPPGTIWMRKSVPACGRLTVIMSLSALSSSRWSTTELEGIDKSGRLRKSGEEVLSGGVTVERRIEKVVGSGGEEEDRVWEGEFFGCGFSCCRCCFSRCC